jgi:outer membrane protein assembly factor BamD (BamD/ComL family)
MRKFFPVFIAAAIFIAGCTSHDQWKHDAQDDIGKANQSFVTNHPDTALVENARQSVNRFIKRFPDDTISPSLLFDLALVFEKQRQYDSTLKTLDRVYSFYPHSKQASKAVFLEGFLYANVLNQLDQAKKLYQLYLDQYSAVDSKMTSDVKMELQNLGKTPEEILKEIQEKAARDSTKAPS